MAQVHETQLNYPARQASKNAYRILIILCVAEFAFGALVAGSIVYALMGGQWWVGYVVAAITVPIALVGMRHLNREIRDHGFNSKGSEGECRTAALLHTLPDDYHVIHGVQPSIDSGDIDHMVVGPTGVFCLDTKYWRGTVRRDADGEPIWNNQPRSKRHARALGARIMRLREEIGVTGPDSPYFKGALVFPIAFIEDHQGGRSTIDFIRLETLIEYIQQESPRRDRLTSSKISRLVNLVTPYADGVALKDEAELR